MFSRRSSQSGAEGASLVARAAWAFVTPALVLLIYVLGKPARGDAARTAPQRLRRRAARLARLPDSPAPRFRRYTGRWPPNTRSCRCRCWGTRTSVRAARRRRAHAACTHTHASFAAPVLSSPRAAARDAPSAVPPLPVLSGAVPSAPGPFKAEDYVLSPALVRVRFPSPFDKRSAPAEAAPRTRTRLPLQRFAIQNVILVTWANDHYFDFVMNWVTNLQRVNVTNYMVGAMDDDLLHRLIAERVPTWSMQSGLTVNDFGWGTPTFHKMGRSKIDLIYKFVSMVLRCAVFRHGAQAFLLPCCRALRGSTFSCQT